MFWFCLYCEYIEILRVVPGIDLKLVRKQVLETLTAVFLIGFIITA